VGTEDVTNAIDMRSAPHRNTVFERCRSPFRAQPIDLYYGLFGDSLSINLLDLTTNETILSGEMAVQDSQALSLIPNTTTSLNILGSSNAENFLLIKFVGDPLPLSGVFYTALESFMDSRKETLIARSTRSAPPLRIFRLGSLANHTHS